MLAALGLDLASVQPRESSSDAFWDVFGIQYYDALFAGLEILSHFG